MARRSSAALYLLVEGLRQLGEDVAPLLAEFGIDPAHLDPGALIDRELELRINIAIGERLRDPLAGLRAGTALSLGVYGPFTLLLLSSQDVLSSFQAAVQFQRLSFLFGELGFEPGAAQSAIRLLPRAMPARASRFRTDLEVAGIWKLAIDINRAAQSSAVPRAIVMPYARPPEAAAYVKVFGCPVDWGAEIARVVWDNASLHQRFATADPRLHELLRAQCQRQIVALDAQQTAMAPRVSAHLAAHSGALPSLPDTATALGHSERHLRRKLQAESTSYRALLDGVHLQKAQELLADARLSVEAIAQRLGYSETAAFVHAFKRWTGSTPASYRRAQRSIATLPRSSSGESP